MSAADRPAAVEHRPVAAGADSEALAQPGRWRRLPLAWRRRMAVAFGGMVGTALRVAVGLATPAGWAGWPWATFAVNVSGALALGFLLSRLLRTAGRTAVTVPLLCTGLLGSYTTFSAFSLELVQLAERGDPAGAVAYAVTSVGAGLAAAYAGSRLAEGRR